MPAPINIATRPLIAHTAGAAVRPAPGMPRNYTAGKIIGAEKQIIEKEKQKVTFEDRTIGTLGKLRQFGTSLLMFGWVGPIPVPMIAIPVLTAIGFKSGATAANMVFTAPIEALKDTNAVQWYKAPATMLQNAATLAEQSEGTLIRKVADPLQKAANLTARHTDRFGASLTTAMKPVGDAMVKGADGFGRSAMGQQLENSMGQLAGWRAARHQVQSTKFMAKSADAFTRQPTGWMQALKNFVTRNKPAVTPIAEELKIAQGFVKSGQLQESFEAVGQFIGKMDQSQAALTNAQSLLKKNNVADAMEALTKIQPRSEAGKQMLERGRELLKQGDLKSGIEALGKVFDAADQTAIAQGRSALGHLTRASESVAKAGHIKDTLGKGLGGLMKGASKTKLYGALIAGGIVAGIGATVLLTGKESRKAKAAVKELTEDLGGDAKHPLVVQAAKLDKGQGVARWMNTASSAAGEALWLATMNQGASAIPVQMAIQGGLPMATQLFFKDNALLDAYMSLKAAEKGEIQVSAENKAMWLTQLVAMTPLARKHGAEQNIGAQQMGALLVEKGLSVRDALQTLNDPAKFEALAKEVVEKNAAKTLTPANDGPSTQVKEAAPATLKGAAPDMKIELGNVANNGRLSEHQKIRA